MKESIAPKKTPARTGALKSLWGEELAVQMLPDAGFSSVTVQRLEHDIQNNWYVATNL